MSHIQIDIVMEGTKILYMRIKKVRKGRIKPNISTYINDLEAPNYSHINRYRTIIRNIDRRGNRNGNEGRIREVHDIFIRR